MVHTIYNPNNMQPLGIDAGPTYVVGLAQRWLPTSTQRLSDN